MGPPRFPPPCATLGDPPSSSVVCAGRGTAVPPWPVMLPPPHKRLAKCVSARGPLREAVPARSWATRVLRRPAAPVLCHWAVGGFGPLAFSHFPIF
jgi:hypothetical protein